MYSERVLLVDDVKQVGSFISDLLHVCITRSICKEKRKGRDGSKAIPDAPDKRRATLRLFNSTKSFNTEDSTGGIDESPSSHSHPGRSSPTSNPNRGSGNKKQRVVYGVVCTSRRRGPSMQDGVYPVPPLLLVQRTSCSPKILAAFNSMSVSRIFLPVQNMKNVLAFLKSRSTSGCSSGEAGADSSTPIRHTDRGAVGDADRNRSESCIILEDGSEETTPFMVIEAPGRVVFHLVTVSGLPHEEALFGGFDKTGTADTGCFTEDDLDSDNDTAVDNVFTDTGGTEADDEDENQLVASSWASDSDSTLGASFAKNRKRVDSVDSAPNARLRERSGSAQSEITATADEDQHHRVYKSCCYIVDSIVTTFHTRRTLANKRSVLYPPRFNKHKIPTMESAILSHNQRFYPFETNAPKPIPFETDLFKGICFFTHAHPTLDEEYKSFYNTKKKVTYEIQVQGKFKRLPQGELYCGAEACEKMELGFMTKTFSNVALKFAATIVDDLHYSFGEDQTNCDDFEYPHLVGPLFPTLDKIIVNKPGEPLQPLGKPFLEDPEYRKARLKMVSSFKANINLEDTYSFSVNTANIDTVSWQFVNIPMMGTMDLQNFFGDSPLQLICYEIPTEVAKGYKTHPQKYKNYVFNVRLTKMMPGDIGPESDTEYLESEAESEADDFPNGELDWGTSSEEDEASEVGAFSDVDEDRSIDDLEGDGHLVDPEVGEGDENDETDETEDGPKFKYRDGGDQEEQPSKMRFNQYLSFMDRSGGGGVHQGFVKNLFRGLGANVPMPSLIDIPDTSGEFLIPSHETETTHSLRYCPATIEVFDSRKKTMKHMYLLPFSSQTGKPGVLPTDDEVLLPRLRSYEEVAKKLTMEPIPKLHKNKIMVTFEKKRRQIVESYLQASKSAVYSVAALLANETEADKEFLTHNAKKFKMLSLNSLNRASDQQQARRNLEKLWGGSVALALGNRHWIEYYMIVMKNGVGISLLCSTKEMWIPLQSMIRVVRLPPENRPFQGFSFLLLETHRKGYYLAVKDDSVLNDLLTALRKIGVTEELTVDRSASSDIFDDKMVFKSRMEIWKLTKRRLYNCRRLRFTAVGVMEPNELVESLLAKVLELSEFLNRRGVMGSTKDLTMTNENDSKMELILMWFEFMDQLSDLQVLNLVPLSETQRAAFFLNLYHLMVIHGALVKFPPKTSSTWQTFINEFAYLVDFNVMSIADVEHNILKASMSVMPRLTLGLESNKPPKSVYPGLALSHRDFRLHFCINNGSVPNREVCIFKADTLDQQLDMMARAAIRSSVFINTSKRTVSIPRHCCWYAPDFVAKGIVASPVDCLRTIASYCDQGDREKLNDLLMSGQSPKIKYHNCFKSRMLTRYDESA